MAMEYEIAFAIGGGVNHLPRQRYPAEIDVDKLFEKFVMVTCDVNDLSILPAFTQEFLDEHIVIIPPVPFAFQLPAINDVADQIKILAFDLFQEIQQSVDLGMARADVHI